MPSDLWNAVVLGATTNATWLKQFETPLLVLAALILPFMIGRYYADRVRMQNYGWKFGVVLCSLAVSAVVLAKGELHWGVDLRGGVILIYQIDEAATAQLAATEKKSESDDPDQPGSGAQGVGRISSRQLVTPISRRINPVGTKEIVVRPYGDKQIEIIVPEVDPIEVERIKKLIYTAGSLEFRIVANREDHQELIDLATEQPSETFIRDKEGVLLGRWIRIGRETNEVGGIKPLKFNPVGSTFRDSQTREWIRDLPPQATANIEGHSLEKWLKEAGHNEVEVLMYWNDGYDVLGDHIGVVSGSFDETMRPCVNFSMKSNGSRRFAGLTREFSPDNSRNMFRLLGIVFDNELISAPRIITTIADNGRITGNFSQAEVDFLVDILRAGSLPAAMQKTPISESQIGSLLGEDTIDKGATSIIVSLAAVLAFTWWYYRFAGFVACLALIFNLVLTLAFMVLIKAPLTLPGLAGLVLSVGMSVDANVLIYERMREEKVRGSALRLTIRNGFSRAMATIVDSNLTTILTAVVLYVIGTDQLKGFAVTLILGIAMSMYTAIFCSHVLFDLCERRGWIKDLRFRQVIGVTKFDFMGVRRPAILASLVLIGLGFMGVVARGKQVLDIDFNGGTAVLVTFQEPTSADRVRELMSERFQREYDQFLTEPALQEMLDGDLKHLKRESLKMTLSYTVNGMDIRDKSGAVVRDVVYKVDSSIPEVPIFEQVIQRVFREGDKSLLASYEMEITSVTTQTEEIATPTKLDTKPGSTELPAVPEITPVPIKPATPEKKVEPKPEDKPEEKKPEDKKPDDKPAAPEKKEEPKPEPAKPEEKKPDEKKSDDKPATPEKKPEDKKPDDKPDVPEKKEEPKPEPAKPEEKKPDEKKPDDKPAAPEKKEEPKPEPAKPEEKKPEDKKSDDKPATPDANSKSEVSRSRPEVLVAFAGSDLTLALANLQEDKPAGDKPAEEKKDEPKPEPAKSDPSPPAATSEKKDLPAAPETKPAETKPEPAPITAKPRTIEKTEAKLNFGKTLINASTLQFELAEVANSLKIGLGEVQLRNPAWDGSSNVPYAEWTVILNTDRDSAEKVLQSLKAKFAAKPIWQASSKIGAKVAGDMQSKAIQAMLASFLGVLLYIRLRFHRFVFGIAAIAAVFHDALITIGAIALSLWLSKFLGFAQVEEFKIDLTIVAAVLTIIGYSLNDTIVIFDRLREIKGKSPTITHEMINDSINQTLSRTLLTAFTTLMVVVVMYFMGGPGVHAFAFAMLVGVTAGTYSTVYIASPVLLWAIDYDKRQAAREKKVTEAKSAAV